MKPERIDDGVVVTLTYRMIVDGKEAEIITAEDPLEYLHGAENIVPGLEAALYGKRAGDKVNVTLTPDQAYGDYDEDDVEVLQRASIPGAEDLRPGMPVELEDDEGFVYEAVVREVTDKEIVLDFNPPLAGKTLTYHVEVLDLREATEDELDHGHPHPMDMDDEYGFHDDDLDGE
jgi:FKBP-type peptidyl-prolyl cis-trans isomerase SlyD